MPVLYLFFVIFFSFSSFSQINEVEKTTNSTNSNTSLPVITNSTNVNAEPSGDVLLDSLPANQSQQVSKKQVNKSKDLKNEVTTGKSILVDDSVSAYEKMEFQFSQVKVQSSSQRDQRTPTLLQQTQMSEIVDYFKKNAPESFEYHFYKYVAGNYSLSLIDHLFKAEKLQPNNKDVQLQLAAYYLILNDPKNALVYLKKIFSMNQGENNQLIYAKDLLQSAPENGTLITHGVEDTYSCLYMQMVNHLRPDVQIVSLELLQSQEYRSQLLSKNYLLPSSLVIDVAYLQSFCSLNESKSLSISLTTPKEYFLKIKEKLYIVGLVFEYHSSAFNNFYKNDYLWNEVLKKKIAYAAANETYKPILSNYLPMLLQLRAFYSAQENFTQLKIIDEVLDKVAKQCDKYEPVQKIIKVN
jgi:hypothetical protein